MVISNHPPKERCQAPGIATIVVAASLLIGSTQEPAFAATTSTAQSVIASLASRTAAISGYTVNVTAHLRMRTFPFVRVTFHGSASYQRPGNFTVSLSNAELANGYKSALQNMGDPATWLRDYDAAVDVDKPAPDGVLVLRLQPKVGGDLDHTLAYVRLATMTVDQIDWFYVCGGHIEMKQRYAAIDGVLMVSHQDLDITMPKAKLFAQTDLDNYALRTVIGNATSSARDRAGW